MKVRLIIELEINPKTETDKADIVNEIADKIKVAFDSDNQQEVKYLSKELIILNQKNI